MTAVTPRDLLRAEDVIDSFRVKRNIADLQRSFAVYPSNGVIDNA
jgi:hypothetical protein